MGKNQFVRATGLSPLQKTIFAAVCFFASSYAEKTPIGSISQVIGSAVIRHDGETAWTKARLKMSVFDGDAIATSEESQCEITMPGDRIARFGDKTTVILSEKNGGDAKIKAAQGTVWVNVKHLVNNRSFGVTTSTAVAAIRGTVFEVECGDNSSNYLVFKGSVAVSASGRKGAPAADSTFFVKAGDQVTLVRDMNRYMKDQEKVMRDFLRESDEELEKFNRDEQDQFDKYEKELQEHLEKMLTEERGAFKKLDDINYAVRKINLDKIAKSAWINWNQERDKELGW
jgi:hypothetical protein